jgi:thiol-disulfide isomerase/thioredoxin
VAPEPDTSIGKARDPLESDLHISFPMLKKAVWIIAGLGAAIVLFGYVAYLGNAAPAVAALSPEEAARNSKPYVIKLHAQWCPVCLMTKDVWSEIEKTYAGRVNLVVFDFTNDENTEASKALASRLGLDRFFEEYAGASGTIAVLDGRTKQVKASIKGSRNFSEYREAIEGALRD